MCLQCVNPSMVVNENLVSYISLGRGLRQGDPLSPYIFILCTGVSPFLKNNEVKGDIHGVKVCRGVAPFSHVLFVDACFLFFKLSDNEITIIKEILDKYGEVSGQTINY